jgi:hypothetical protein
MRLVDALFRQGHLSEQAIVEAIMTGDRPPHLDRCDICAERAVELNRWLDTVRTEALAAADEAFPAERLSAQQTQILRRLEQLDEPARVIAFPVQSRSEQRETSRRRVAAGWVGVAAAAGLVIGVIGGQVSARLSTPPTAPTVVIQAPGQPQSAEPNEPALSNTWMDLDDLDGFKPSPLGLMDQATPRTSLIATVALN